MMRIRKLSAVAVAGLLVVATSCGGNNPGGDSSSSPSRTATQTHTNPASARSSATASTSAATSGEPSSSAGKRSSSAGKTSTASAPSTSTPHASDLVTGLTAPWGLVVFKDGSALVNERDSKKIKKVSADDHQVRTVKTMDPVQPGGSGTESGLLGLTASRDHKTIFAYYTGSNDNRIAKMSWNGHKLGKPKVILTGIPKGSIHNGGRMIVDKHDYLFVGTGETGSGKLSQDKDSLGGKILRITADGKPAPGNPFDSPVYSYGHRNVQGLAFDDQGQLWASEFGADKWDELNLIKKGKNYGWPKVEGKGGGKKFVDPVKQWHTGEASPSGLAFWKGSLWMAALRGSRLWQIPLKDGKAQQPVEHFDQKYGRLRTVVGGPHNTLWLSTSNKDTRGEPKNGDDRLLLLKQ